MRVKEHSLSNNFKKDKVNLDRVLDVHRQKGKHELVTEQKKKKLDGLHDKPIHGQYLS